MLVSHGLFSFGEAVEYLLAFVLVELKEGGVSPERRFPVSVPLAAEFPHPFTKVLPDCCCDIFGGGLCVVIHCLHVPLGLHCLFGMGAVPEGWTSACVYVRVCDLCIQTKKVNVKY